MNSNIIGLLNLIIIPLILALLFSFFYKKAYPKYSYLAEPKKVSHWLDSISLKLLLPIFVIHSVLDTKIELNYSVIIYIVIGILLPFAVFFSGKLLQREKISNELILSISTHGGGNRGVLTILLIWGNSESFNNIITFFMLYDFGHTIFMIMILPFIIRRSLGLKKMEKKSGLDLKKILSSYAVIAILWIVVTYILLTFNLLDPEGLKNTLEESKPIRKTVFSVFLLSSIFLKISLSSLNLKEILSSLLFFIITKVASLTVLILLSLLLIPFHINFLGIIILACMPPSSMLPAMAFQAKIPYEMEEEINKNIVVYNLLFLISIFLLIFFIIVFQ